MKRNVPAYADAVLRQLHACGYEAYAVGGCVRDVLLGRTPNDWDVCTSALPEQTLAAFAGWRVIETGLQHGTVTVLSDGQPVEVTTYRIDGAYTDHRRPDAVSFTRSLAEDLARRDFTVNAMAFDPETGLVDLYGGRDDLAAGVLRCVGEPEKRFSEDALRMIRALRFASVLGFSIEPDTAKAARALCDQLRMIAVERVAAECGKLLCGKGAATVLAAHGAVLFPVLPELLTDQESLAALDRAPASLPVRWAILLRKTDAAAVLKRLKLDTATIRRTALLVSYVTVPLPRTEPEQKRLLGAVGETAVRQILDLREALGDELGDLRQQLEALMQSGACCTLSQLAVTGRDLLAAGCKGGPALGAALQALLDAVIDGVCENEKTALLAFFQKTTL